MPRFSMGRRLSTHRAERMTLTDRAAPTIRRLSVLIALFWLGLAVVTNVFVPQLEKVAESHNVSLSPQDARRCRPVNASARCFRSSIRTAQR